VLDFVNQSFTLWEHIPDNTIYSVTKIDRNYAEYFQKPDKKVMEDIKDKIYKVAYGDDVDKALRFQSRAIAGHNEDKIWASYLGNRDCGKGVEYDLLKNAFGNLVDTFELGNMLYCRKTAGLENVDCSKKLYWLMDLEFVRLAISQEIPAENSGLICNSKMLKKISGGGDEIVARRNYDRKDTHFTLDTTFYMKGNSKLQHDNNDVYETNLHFNCVYQFKDNEYLKNLNQKYNSLIDGLKAEITEQENKEIDISKGITAETIEENILELNEKIENLNSARETEISKYLTADPEIKIKCHSEEYSNAIVYILYEAYNKKRVAITKIEDVEINSITLDIYTNLKFDKNSIVKCQDVYDALENHEKSKIDNELKFMKVEKKKC
jgi:hypothetical protein